MEKESKLVESLPNCTIEIEGHTLSVETYDSGKDDWILVCCQRRRNVNRTGWDV